MSLIGNVFVCSVAALLQLSQSSIEIRCSQDPQQGKPSSRTATIHQLTSQLVANYFDDNDNDNNYSCIITLCLIHT